MGVGYKKVIPDKYLEGNALSFVNANTQHG